MNTTRDEVDGLKAELTSLEDKIVSKALECDELAVEAAAKSAKVEELELIITTCRAENQSIDQFAVSTCCPIRHAMLFFLKFADNFVLTRYLNAAI